MQWYEDPEPGPQIVEYESQDDFQREATDAAQHGWRIVSVTELSQRSGCMRILTLGFFALLWKPKAHVLATYERKRRRR